MNLPASQLDEAERDHASRGARAAAMKFTYPSGSRPLEGYTIKRGVGRGGFGEVYFATSDAGKEVAIKLIRRNLEVELRGVTQCLNLKHPNLIGLYDIRGDGMDDQWVIMEYVSGESLEDVIDRHPNGMPIDEVLFWMHGICGGVGYLHDHGIVHRDLKPGNIFLDEGTVKIGDYGLAKFISCSRRSGQTESVGTVHYMAPEIANGRYGREIDTYALGVILYEMLTGTVPFEGESVGEVLMKHLTAEPDLARVADPYRDIVRRALAKDPDSRIKSVAELLSLLPGAAASVASVAAKYSANSEPSDISDVILTPVEPGESFGRAEGLVPKIEEPIWKALREAYFSVQRRWSTSDSDKVHPLSKALLIFAVVAAFFTGLAETMLAFAVPVLVCYGIYYVIWSATTGSQASKSSKKKPPRRAAPAADRPASNLTEAWYPADSEPSETPAARYAQRIRRRRARPSWRERAHRELAAKPFRDRLAELLGSMLLVAAFAALAALIAPVLLRVDGQSGSMAVYAWLALVGTLGSWAILIPTKFAEGKVEDQVPLRVLLLLLGGLVGVASWGLAEALIVSVPSSGEPVQIDSGLISHGLLEWRHPESGANPSLAVYVTYFAFLFLLVRWWRQAEYTRSARLSLWNIAVCVFWAWLLQFFWWFPQPAGMMAAGVIAFATQMSSPWLPPSRRRALTEEVEVEVERTA